MIRHPNTAEWTPGETSSISASEKEIAEILEQYLEAIESGQHVAVSDVLAKHPQYAEELQQYLEGIAMLQGGFGNRTDDESNVASEFAGGRELGDYKLIREVGRGGMGVVYEAQQLSLNRRVALKVLPFASMLDSRQIKRFENEARAAAQLHHPNIVPVYGVGCQRGVHYYAMQFIEGQTLADAIAELAAEAPETTSNSLHTGCSNGSKRFQEIARIGVQAARALHAAHQCGVIHRDIKPSNIMLDGRGETWITDFGLARVQTDQNVTRSGDIVGTLHYMSPEQACGNATIAGPRSDVYSLAVTLYELATLQRPFEGESHGNVLRQIEQGVCKPPRHWNPSIPSDFENVIMKGMSTDPVDRYPSAAEMEEDLQRFIDGKPTRAKPPTAFQIFAKWSARNRAVVASTLTALTLTAVALAGTNLSLMQKTKNLEARQLRLDTEIDAAKDQLDVALESLEAFGLFVDEFLRNNVAGSEEERQALLDSMLTAYSRLIPKFEDSPTLRKDAAITHTKMATVFDRMGDHEEALNAYAKAKRLFAQLPNSDAELANCLSSSGLLLSKLGRHPSAMRAIQDAIRIQQELVAVNSDPRLLVALSNSLVNLAALSESDAEASFDRAVKLLADAKRESPDSQEVLRALANVTGTRGTQLAGHSPGQAIRYLQFAVQNGRTLCSGSQVAPADRSKLATHCSNLGTLYAQQSQPQRAIEAYRLAVTNQREVGDNASLVITLGNLAKTQQKLDMHSEAANSYREAISVQSTLLNQAPGNLNHVSRLGGLYNNLGFIWKSAHKPVLAEEAYHASIKYQRRAFELAPHVDAFRDAYSRTLYNASQVAVSNREWELAAQLHLDRAKIWPENPAQLKSAANGITAAAAMLSKEDKRQAWDRRAERLLESAKPHGA